MSAIKNIQLDSWLSNSDETSHWWSTSLKDACEIPSLQIDSTKQPYCEMIQIGAEDMESGTGNILTTKTAIQQNVSGKNYFFNEESILYSKIRPYLKKIVFPKFTGICSIDIFPLSPKDNILPDLLYYLLISETFTRYAISQSAGTAFPRVNRNGFLAFCFRLPPREEQKRIVDKTTEIFYSLNLTKQHLENSRKLKKELLSHLVG